MDDFGDGNGGATRLLRARVSARGSPRDRPVVMRAGSSRTGARPLPRRVAVAALLVVLGLGGGTASEAASPVASASGPPVNTASPAVTGTAVVGATLTASPGSWSGTEPMSYAYGWERCEPGYAGLVLAAGPIGYWRFGETSGATAADASGLGHDGGYVGGFALGQSGALALDGDRAVGLSSVSPAGTVTVPHRPSMNFGNSVTYEAWVRLSSLPAASSVGANIATKSTGSLVLRILPSGVLSVRKSGGLEMTRSTAPMVADGRYHHVVAAKEGLDVRVYLDGVDVTGLVIPQTLKKNGTHLTVAGNFPSENRDGINGFLDEFALYGRGLSAAEVAEHYAAGREGLCAPVAGADGQTFRLGTEDAGSALRVNVTASNAQGTAAARSAATGLVSPATAPASTAAPTVTGSAVVGETLTASRGDWSGSEPMEYAYLWRRCDSDGGACGNVAGATATAYTLTEADVDAAIRVAVTASNVAGAATAVSDATGPVPPTSPPASPPENTAAPAVSGETVVGGTLSASTGTWSGTQPLAYAYRWERCEPGYAELVLADAPIGYWRLGEASGATAVDVSGLGHDGGYAGAFALGEAGALAVDADRAVGFSSVTPAGTVTVAHRASLSYGDAVTYEAWVRLTSLPAASSVGANIATKSTGTLVLRILPSGVLSVRKSGASELTRSTAPLVADGDYHHVVAVKAGADVRVYIDAVDVTGSVTQQTLTNNGTQLTIASNNTAENRDGLNGSLDEFALYGRGLSPAEVAEHYAAGRDGVCAPVAGADEDTYLLGFEDEGSALRVGVTASNTAGSATALSASTEVVTGPPPSAPANTALPTIAGEAREGETLTASSGSWSGTGPIDYAYQWRRCDSGGGGCTDVNTTSAAYTLTQDDVDATMRVAVTASNAGGSATAVSEASAPVAPAPPASPPENTAAPAVSGETVVGGTLSASTGTWSGSQPIAYAYRWERCEPGYAQLVLADGPIGYWRFGESSGATAADASGLSHDGGYVGSFALGQAGALAVDGDPAVGVSPVSPAGTVAVAHRASLNYGDAVTYEAWVRLSSLPSASSVGANIATKSTGSLVLRILPSGVLSVRKSGGSELTQSTAPLVADGDYHHVIAVKAGADVRVYLDGVDVTGPVTQQTLANNGTQLTIAGKNTAENRDGINGFLDEFALYGRGLSAGEVAEHYAAGREGVCAPVAGADEDTYLLGAEDAGSALRVEVTASNTAGTASALSASTGVVTETAATAPANTSAPSVTGNALVGETLTASTGSWTGTAPIQYAYQWRRCDAGGGACTDIAGAATATYTLTQADVDATIRAAVTASNAAGSATAVSPPTAQVRSWIGYAGPSFSGAGDSSPTGSKPESKLWWNDGSWWATMWSQAAGSYHIFRLDLAAQTWVDTGTQIDTRVGTRADALWDGTHLYVASHVYSTCGCSTPATGNPSRLYRYRYDALTSQYVLDPGFPVPINDTRSETLVIDKDSTGTLWATWAQSNRVFVNRTLGDDATWGTPFALPLAEAQDLVSDDISSIVAFGGGKVGVMWSNQTRSAMYFAVHLVGDPADVWQAPEVALGGPEYADDHINLHADASGRVLVAMKTSRGDLSNPNPDDPQIMVLARAPATGAWAGYPAGRIRDDHTRPILLLDEDSGTIHVFATAPTAGGTIYHKSSPLGQISFPVGLGTPFLHGGSSAVFNNVTSTKQNVNRTTGIVVAAAEGSQSRYWHNYLSLGG